MQITRGIAHTLFVGLTALDQQAEKLSPDTRFKIAMNLDRLRPPASALERSQGRAVADKTKEAAASVDPKTETQIQAQARQADLQANIAEMIEAMRDVSLEIDLDTMTKAELRAAENPKISGATIAQILPLLAD